MPASKDFAASRRRQRLISATGPAALLCLLAVVTVAAAPLAKKDCKCRYFGKYYSQGDVICMRGPTGLRLARCEQFLNNPSWNITVTPCPAA